MRQKDSGESLVVKYIHAQSERIDAARVIREVSILLSLNHGSILKIRGWSLPNDECKDVRMATELMIHGFVGDVLKKSNDGQSVSFWTHENISILIVGIVHGLRYIHWRDAIHRNLKPSNLFIDEKFRIRIGDFVISGIGSLGLLIGGTNPNVVGRTM